MNVKKNLLCSRGNLYARAMACLLGTAIVLAGCSGPGFLQKKPTAVSLAKTAVEKMQKAESAAVDMDLDASMNLSYDQLNIGMKVDLAADVDMEMTKDPQLAGGTQTVRLEMMGQSREFEGRFYLDPSGGPGTTYMQWGDGKWMKKTNDSGAGDGETNHTDTEDPGSSGSSGKEEMTEKAQDGSGSIQVLQAVGLVKAIAEEAMRAELQEETVTINDREAWQIDCTLTGAFLKTMLESYDKSSGSGTGKTGPFDLASVDWDAVEVPAQVFIYKETGFPARIRLDCGTIGKELVKGPIDDALGKFPLGSISLDVDDCVIDLTFDRYDEIVPIEIPQEALEAEESDDLGPNLESLLGL